MKLSDKFKNGLPQILKQAKSLTRDDIGAIVAEAVARPTAAGSAAAVWLPHPDNKPQVDAYNCVAFETLYGGAAGGGKSDLILGLARTKHKRALLLRRTFPDLERSLITRSLEFYGDVRLYNSSKHVWSIDDQRIEFGHMEQVGTPQAPKDEGSYASAQYDFVGFDQLEQFPQYAYEFMFSRVRTVKDNQRVRMVSTANPVGEGVAWIMDRWGAWLDETHPNRAKSGEIRWYKRNAEGREVETTADDPDAVSRTFIAAGLSDNPYIKDDYRKQLALLPEPLRSALMLGLWSAMLTDDAYQVIPRAWIKAAMDRWSVDGKGNGQAFTAVDVARGGDDYTVIARRWGDWYAELEKHSGRETKQGQDVVALIMNEAGATGIDVIGVGASAYDIATMQNGLRVGSINFANKSDETDKSGTLKFVNKRAEYYWKLREALAPDSEYTISLPPDPQLLGDLISPHWSMQSNGIKIEENVVLKIIVILRPFRCAHVFPRIDIDHDKIIQL